MSGRRHRLLSALAVLAAGLLTGCRGGKVWPGGGAASAAHAQGAPRRVILALFDVSGSTNSPAIRARYLSGFQKVLDECTGGELLMGDIITQNTLATASFPLQQMIPSYSAFTDNPLTYKQKRRKAVEAALHEADQLVHQASAPAHTDLMNAFQLADKVFNGERARGTSSKILVIFSDMVEQSPRHDFTGEKLTDRQIQQIITAERQAERLPDLHGVKVWVAGATAATRGALPPEQIEAIQRFWLRYFQACGADLTKERYASTLINFELEP